MLVVRLRRPWGSPYTAKNLERFFEPPGIENGCVLYSFRDRSRMEFGRLVSSCPRIRQLASCVVSSSSFLESRVSSVCLFPRIEETSEFSIS